LNANDVFKVKLVDEKPAVSSSEVLWFIAFWKIQYPFKNEQDNSVNELQN
jgi:hypothetical protein